MNKKLLTGALLGSVILAFAGKGNDPVLMKIDGKDVKLSEFEYLYHKNNTQQQSPVSFEEYVDMFVDYKLKVADAQALGVDTTAKFIAEYRRFSDDLAYPFLRDSLTHERLVMEAYQRMCEEKQVAHIMLDRDANGSDNAARLDSIRREILAGNITFEDAARTYSIDTPSARRGGTMGWIRSGVTPYAFERVAYATPEGEISEVVNSGFGFHIVKPISSRPDPGEVKASHILLLTKDKTPEECEAQKAKIDSLYNIAISGANFAALAKQYSEDPGSARNGGDLGWFGKGRMVPEFETTAYNLAKGEISKPFSTSYGYHIIYKTDVRGGELLNFNEARKDIERAMENDNRHMEPIDATLNRLAAETNSQVNPKLIEELNAYAALKGLRACDSIANEELMLCQVAAYTVNGKTTTVGDVIKQSNLPQDGGPIAALGKIVKGKCNALFHKDMVEYGREYLYNTNADYRNLANEYRDGILLFEVANNKVWERATNDTEGLNAYFQANKDKYTWESPRFKSYVIFATNDSIHSLVQEFTNGLDASALASTDLSRTLKEKFGNNVRVERVIAAKGENAITDYLGFGCEKPDLKNSRWAHFYAFAPKMLDAPEEVADIRGIVVTDYQAQLEKEWLDQLHKTYKVKINKKVLKQAK